MYDEIFMCKGLLLIIVVVSFVAGALFGQLHFV